MLGGGEALRLFFTQALGVLKHVELYHISKAPDRTLLQNVYTIFFKV
jgi:hypothetical protein